MTHPEGEQEHRIVVGVDGSVPLKAALAWAVRQARLTGAAVEAVIAWEFPATFGYPLPRSDVDRQHLAARAVADAVAVVSGLGEPVKISSKVVEGNAARVLVDASAGAELLVVGSRGHAASSKPCSGRFAALRPPRQSCPVVVIRRGYRPLTWLVALPAATDERPVRRRPGWPRQRHRGLAPMSHLQGGGPAMAFRGGLLASVLCLRRGRLGHFGLQWPYLGGLRELLRSIGGLRGTTSISLDAFVCTLTPAYADRRAPALNSPPDAVGDGPMRREPSARASSRCRRCQPVGPAVAELRLRGVSDVASNRYTVPGWPPDETASTRYTAGAPAHMSISDTGSPSNSITSTSRRQASRSRFARRSRGSPRRRPAAVSAASRMRRPAACGPDAGLCPPFGEGGVEGRTYTPSRHSPRYLPAVASGPRIGMSDRRARTADARCRPNVR